ncbi:MAG: hypothetical protein OEY23_10260 [Acidimicrobiia bacterium]|nr:hypothetical protein [Acidimicrobiia bacterium]
MSLKLRHKQGLVAIASFLVAVASFLVVAGCGGSDAAADPLAAAPSCDELQVAAGPPLRDAFADVLAEIESLDEAGLVRWEPADSKSFAALEDVTRSVESRADEVDCQPGDIDATVCEAMTAVEAEASTETGAAFVKSLAEQCA